MLYAATVLRDSESYVIPNKLGFVPHHTVLKTQRVGVLAETEDKLWVFAYPLFPDAGFAGWLPKKNIKNDPILLLDCYHGDFNGKFPFEVAIDSWRYFGVSMKATQGLKYDTSWLKANWKKAHEVAGKRLGDSWFVGSYHYLMCAQDGAKQADYYCQAVEKAGGWSKLVANILPEVDVEEKGNENCTKQQVLDCTQGFIDRIKKNLGCDSMLYGRSLMANLGIVSHMHAKRLWVARYNSILPKDTYEKIGWKVDEVGMWQFMGDTVNLTKFVIDPKFATTDTSVRLYGNLVDMKKDIIW